MAAGVSLYGAIQKAREIRLLVDSLEDHKVETVPELETEFANNPHKVEGEKIRRLAEILYRDGMEMVAAELSENSYIHEETTVDPIMVSLHSALKSPSYQRYLGSQRALSKVFRIFAEMAWYQPWRMDKEIPVNTKFRKDLIDIAELMKLILKDQKNMTGANFELRCAKQAAQLLKPSTEHWKKYLELCGDLAAGAAGRSIPIVWDALKKLAKELYRDNPGRGVFWYPKVHILRWESTQVQDLEGFKNKIVTEIPECKEEGGNLSLCLATILIELIETENMDPDVKKRAFYGHHVCDGRTPQHDGLVDLITWEREGTLQDYKNYPLEIPRKILRRRDRFYETRDLVVCFLIKLKNQQEAYSEYSRASSKALKARELELRSRKSVNIAKEKKLITREAEVKGQEKSAKKEVIENAKERKKLEPGRDALDMDEETRKAKYEALMADKPKLEGRHKELVNEVKKVEKERFDVKVQSAIIDNELELISDALK